MDHFKILSLSLRFAPICSFDPSHNHLMLNNRAMFQHGSFFISDHFGSFRMVHFQCVMLKSSFSLCLNPAILWIQMDGQAAEKCPFFFLWEHRLNMEGIPWQCHVKREQPWNFRRSIPICSMYIHVWYIYLQNWVIFVGQMLVNIPAPWSIWDFQTFQYIFIFFSIVVDEHPHGFCR